MNAHTAGHVDPGVEEMIGSLRQTFKQKISPTEKTVSKRSSQSQRIDKNAPLLSQKNDIESQRSRISSKGKRFFLNILTASAREKLEYEQEVFNIQRDLAYNIRDAMKQVELDFNSLNEINHKENIEKLDARVSNLQKIFATHLAALTDKKRQLYDLEMMCDQIESKITEKCAFKKGISMSGTI